MIKTIFTKHAPEAIGPYSQAKVYGGLLYVSGQIGLDPESGKPAGDTIEAQAEQIMKNVGAILKEAGTDFTKVIKTSCFLTDMDDFATFNEIYGRYFTGKPARSCVAVKTLPKNMLCEVELIAALE